MKAQSEVWATTSFSSGRDGMIPKRLRLPASHETVKRHPTMFEPAPERPESAAVVAVLGFVAATPSGMVRVRIGDTHAVDSPIVRGRERYFVPESWTKEERGAATRHRSFVRQVDDEDTTRRRADRDLFRRQRAERDLEFARADVAELEAKLAPR